MSQIVAKPSSSEHRTATTTPANRELLTEAIQELRQMRTELDAIEQAQTEPLAIIGIGCRFPGAENPAAFWELLHQGDHAIREVSSDRWDREGTLAGTSIGGENMHTRWSGFLDNVADFDPEFFGISPREATNMDPQQRLLLEVAWEALENAGLSPKRLAGSQTGVYMGISTYDYARLNFDNPEAVNAYSATGNAFSIAANRLSYLLNLRGPSFIVDTACSSSLVATHLACRALRNDDCSMALVGGVNLLLTPSGAMIFSQAQMMAADGRCKTFDAEADGYVRAEGCGVVVLKRLGDALRDGDTIHALIRGTAVNHDGRTNGIAAPSELAQQAVIEEALRDARVGPAEIDYIEAHGTGTALGDPIEVNALRAVYTSAQVDSTVARQEPCWLGSVKTNIGHMEAAAGMGGLIKVILSMTHEAIPAHLNFNSLNPYISLDDTPLAIPTEQKPWVRGASPRLAGVNSFGFGGANAHVIVEEAPHAAGDRLQVTFVDESDGAAVDERPLHLLALSAKTPDALKELAQRYATFLAECPEESLANTCFTAAAGRAHFSHRLALAGADHANLSSALRQFTEGEDAAILRKGQVSSNAAPKIAFLFTGQGSQYVDMGRELYETQPVFRDILDFCNEFLRPYLGVPLLSVMFDRWVEAKCDEASFTSSASHPLALSQTAYTQPALFALEYALAQLWLSWGIKPDVMMGHSIGEIVAACVAGVFSLEDGLRLVATRGQLMQELPLGGEMVAILTDEAHVAEIIAPYADVLSIAAVNGPRNVVISGQGEAIQKLVAEFEDAGIQTRQLAVSHAFHSPLMTPMLDEFMQVAQSVVYNPPTIPVLSNVTGMLASHEITTPEYWTRHVRAPVRFNDGVATLCEQKPELFLEIGPKPTLLSMAQATLDTVTPAPSLPLLLPSLRSGHSDWQQMLTTLSALYVHGVEIDWAAFDRPYPRRKVELPTYPFQRQPYWLEPINHQPRAASLRPLIGKMTKSPLLKEVLFETEFSHNTLPFLDDHRVYESVVAPGAGHLALVMSAAELTLGSHLCQLEHVVFPEALIIPEEGTRTVHLVLTPHAANGQDAHHTFQLISIDSEAPAERAPTHASGQVRALAGDLSTPFDPEAIKALCQQEIPIDQFYEAVAEHGLHFGPSFRWLTELWRGVSAEEPVADAAPFAGGEALAKIQLPEAVGSMTGYLLHPGLLDACFQVAGVARTDSGKAEMLVPFAVDSIRLTQTASGNEWWCHAQQVERYKWDIRLQDLHGQVIADISGFEMRAIPRALLQAQRIRKEWLYTVDWQPKKLASENEPTPAAPSNGRWLIFGASEGIGQAVVEQLQVKGKDTLLVTMGEVYTVLHETSDGKPIQVAINPTVPHDFERLLAEIENNEQTSCAGLVYLWGADEVTDSTLVAADVPAATLHLCGGLLHLVQALTEAQILLPLWLVTQTPPQPSPDWGGSRHGAFGDTVSSQGLLEVDAERTNIAIDKESVPPPNWGRLGGGEGGLGSFGRTIALEYPQLSCTSVELDCGSHEENAAFLLAEIEATDDETQIAYRQGVRHVARLARWQPEPVVDGEQPMQLQLSAYGSPDNLQLVPTQRRPPEPSEVELEVRAVGLNFRDVLNALGMLQEYYAEHLGIHHAADVPLGFECAGVVTAVGDNVTNLAVGDAVMGLANGSLATHVTTPAVSMTEIPAKLDFEEAATIPLAFLTAWYGLRHLADLQAGERVLIHAASGGVGQAAVQIAQAIGAEIIGTASPAKWDFLREQGIPHLLNSRTLDFADEVMALTQGAGVDVVLNSLSNDFVDRSFAVLGQNGRFVELGKLGIWSAGRVADERPDASYFPFDLGEELVNEPSLITRLWTELVEQFTEGTLKPLPITHYPVMQVTDAFRFMQEAKHLGKVVIAFEPTERATIQPDASYLITGGLGALGLQMAEQLVEAGARHLVLTGRRGVTSDDANQAITQLEEAGATIQIVQADIAQRDDVERLLGESQIHAPLRGIIHAAGLIDDGLLPQQSLDRFAHVMAPKVEGTWHLHALTSQIPLDFFVCFSSVASLLGSPGQSNYAAANGFMDGLMAQRRAMGLPGLSINWGPWSQVGMAANLQGRLAAQGMGAIAPFQGRQFFNLLYNQDASQIGVLPINWAQFSSQIAQAPGAAFYTTFLQQVSQDEDSDATRAALFAQWAQLSVQDRNQALTHWIQKEIARVLGLSQPPEAQRAFMDLGMDSLMGVELGNRVQSGLGVQLAPTVLFELSTIQDLADHLLPQLAFDEGLTPDSAEQGVPQEVPSRKQEGGHDDSEVDLQQEATLDPTIRVDGNAIPPITVPAAMGSILLTGATGFLGTYLLAELLEQSQADIYCLVRAVDLEAGRERLYRGLRDVRRWDESFAQRIIPVVGNLAEPHFGLAKESYAALATQVEAIYHNGAIINFGMPYRALKATNVEGTQEILRLATERRIKPVHYVSTLSVFESPQLFDGRRIDEETAIDISTDPALGYSKSKWVAEKLVTLAQERGLPATIYRPGIITGDSQTGIWTNTEDLICRVIKGCIQLGRWPDLGAEIYLAPVDYVGKAVVQLGQQPDASNQAYHVIHPETLSLSAIFDWVNAFGYETTPQSPAEWQMGFLAQSGQSDNELAPFIPLMIQQAQTTDLFARLQLFHGDKLPIFGCQNSVARLADSNIDCPEMDRALFDLYLAYLVECGFLEPPQV